MQLSKSFKGSEYADRIAHLEAEVRRLEFIDAKYRGYDEIEPIVTALLTLDPGERRKILSMDLGQYAVGTQNAQTRDAWVAKVLSDLPAGSRLLDAGAGQCQYKHHCGHLDYVSQDVAVYDATSAVGLQNPGWSFSEIDIVCDIVAIPEPDASFDAILCTEVFEHLPDPVRALDELGRLLKPGGCLITTAPFWSLTHQAPFHFATGFNRFFYEHHYERLGLDIVELTPNGNFFECVGQELRRIGDMARRFADDQPRALEIYATQIILAMVQRMSARDTGSTEMLHYDYQIRAIKRAVS
ncbi:class I SAM-dependent methyltransferase [Salinarimonas soli]|nr:class I SAM-dependent methyltransferase [Salinarimonas soli]